MEFNGPIKKAKKKQPKKRITLMLITMIMKTKLKEKDKSDLMSISLKGTKFYPPQNSCEQ